MRALALLALVAMALASCARPVSRWHGRADTGCYTVTGDVVGVAIDGMTVATVNRPMKGLTEAECIQLLDAASAKAGR